jgi:hypothetical protein
MRSHIKAILKISRAQKGNRRIAGAVDESKVRNRIHALLEAWFQRASVARS